MKTKIPRSVILSFIKEKKIDTLSFFMLMRHRYTHRAVFYNWSYRSIAAKMGVSPNTARRHVSYLLKIGMVYIEGKNLSFKGRNALLQDKEKPIMVLVGKTKQDQILYLRNAIIAYNIIRQDRMIAKKISLAATCNDTHGKVTPTQMRMVNKSGGVKKFEESITHRTTLSNMSFGIKLDRSVSSAKRYKRALLKKGLLTRQSHYEFLKVNSSRMEFVYGTIQGKGIGYSENRRSIVKQCSDTIKLAGHNLNFPLPMQRSSSKIAQA